MFVLEVARWLCGKNLKRLKCSFLCYSLFLSGLLKLDVFIAVILVWTNILINIRIFFVYFLEFAAECWCLCGGSSPPATLCCPSLCGWLNCWAAQNPIPLVQTTIGTTVRAYLRLYVSVWVSDKQDSLLCRKNKNPAGPSDVKEADSWSCLRSESNTAAAYIWRQLPGTWATFKFKISIFLLHFFIS